MGIIIVSVCHCNCVLHEILYADDLVLMADSMEELQVKFDRWKSVNEKKGLRINMGMTKEMVCGEGVRE